MMSLRPCDFGATHTLEKSSLKATVRGQLKADGNKANMEFVFSQLSFHNDRTAHFKYLALSLTS